MILILFVSSFALFLIPSSLLEAQPQQRSKDDIVAWLQDALDQSLKKQVVRDSTNNGEGFYEQVENSFTLNGCHLSVLQNGTGRAITHTSVTIESYSLTWDMDLKDAKLSDIKPAQMRLPSFNTAGFPGDATDSTIVIIPSVGNNVHESMSRAPIQANIAGESKTYGSQSIGNHDVLGLIIPLKDMSMADRLVKAFHDLANSCGAKEVNPNL